MSRTSVGARELKTRLGAYLRRVRSGQTLIVTDRGEPIAELRPLVVDESMPPELVRLASTGAVTLPTRTSLATFRPIKSRGRSLAQAVIDRRKDRF